MSCIHASTLLRWVIIILSCNTRRKTLHVRKPNYLPTSIDIFSSAPLITVPPLFVGVLLHLHSLIVACSGCRCLTLLFFSSSFQSTLILLQRYHLIILFEAGWLPFVHSAWVELVYKAFYPLLLSLSRNNGLHCYAFLTSCSLSSRPYAYDPHHVYSTSLLCFWPPN